jgi:RHS repeat-associated protein
MLADGRWLLAGGIAEGEVQRSIAINDFASVKSFPAALGYARANHTATVLPDGTIWVFGGTGADGQLVEVSEFIDAVMGTVQSRAIPGLQLRSHHTATLLVDGTVLLVGGVDGSGKAIESAEIWNPRTNEVQPWRPTLQVPRYDHSATLLASGADYISGGVNGVPGSQLPPEQYNPLTRLFEPAGLDAQREPDGLLTPDVVETTPAADAVDVPVDTLISVRFNTAVHINELNNSTITLIGPSGSITGRAVGAEGGRLAFFTPSIPLLPGTVYTLFVKGVTGMFGTPVPLTSIRFTTHHYAEPTKATAGSSNRAHKGAQAAMNQRTSAVPSVSAQPTNAAKAQQKQAESAQDQKRDDAAEDASEDWLPQERNRHGQWRVLGLKGDPQLSLIGVAHTNLSAAAGVTAIAGHVMRMNGRPLAGVRVSADGQSAVTDANGRFLLTGLSAGLRQLKVDGTGVQVNGRHYTEHFLEVNVRAGKTTALPSAIFLPRVDPQTEVSISSPADREIVLRHPAIPGLEVHIPKGAVLRTYDGKIVTKLSITPIPVDRAPYEAPVPFSVYFTLQPGGAYVDGDPSKAIKIIYPNYQGLPAGSQVNFWNYDPGNGGWRVYGYGKISPDGKTVIPDESVGFRQIMTFGYGIGGSGSTPPAKDGPPPGGCSQGGDPVDCATGLFLHSSTDLVVQDVVPISASWTYRQNDTVSRAFGVGANLSYAMWLSAPDSSGTKVDLVFADGGRVHFSGSNNVFTNTDSPTIFHGAVLQQDTTAHQWALSLADGTVLRFTPHVPNQLVSITDRNGNVVSITLSGSNVMQVTSPNGRFITFNYDSQNRIYQASDNTGRSVSYSYDSSGRLFKVTDAAGYFEQYGYDPTSNGMNSVTDKRGNLVTQNWFDANGRVYKQQLADGAVWQFAYTLDANGRVSQTAVTDPRGYVRLDTFNSSGYVIQRVLAQGQPEQQTYMINRDATNLIHSVTDTLGRQTVYAYDAYGDVTSVTQLYGTSNAVTYGLNYNSTYHQLISYTDPLSHTTVLGRDSSGNLTSITDPLRNVTGIAKNGQGLPTQVTDALGHTVQVGYRGADVASITDGLGHSTSVFTDALGRVESVIDALGNRQQLQYDAMDRVKTVTDPQGGMTSITYDPNGNTLTVTDPRNVVHTYTYDLRNRRATYLDPSGNSESYHYDGMGNLTTWVDRKNQTTQYTYDPLNRLKTITYADNSSITVTWDAGNRPRAFVDTLNGTITRQYDDLDRLTEESGPQGTVDYIYDAAGRRKQMTVTGQSNPIIYTFDDANRLKQIAQGSTTVGLAYDAANRLYTVTFPNGIVGTYNWDNANELLGITYDKGSTHIGDLAYTYDAAGRRISQSGSLARMAVPQGFASATYDGANRLTNWIDTTADANSHILSYDANGNLTGDSTAGVSLTYNWDARHHLATFQNNTGPLAQYAYDSFGRRTSKTQANTTTNYLYDGMNSVLVNGNLMINGPGIDQVYAQVASGGTTSILTDALGSTLMLTDANAATTTTYGYSPYGSGADSFPAQFTGREYDTVPDVYYYRARYYSPQVGRFISEDPIGLAGGPNLYAYTNGNPVGIVDPLGLFGLPSLPQGLVNGLAGIGDALLLDQGARIRRALGIEGGVNECSQAYGIGMAAGVIGSFVDGTGELQLAARLRLVEKLVDAEGTLRVTKTVAAQLEAERSFIPVNAILETITGGTRVADPQGVANFFMYTAEVSSNGSTGRLLEVLVDEANGIIAHVLYKR